MTTHNLQITQAAADHIYDVISTSSGKSAQEFVDDTSSQQYLRIEVSGGGCAGFKYNCYFSSDTLSDDDVVIKSAIKEKMAEVSIVLDKLSLNYLQNSTLDYIKRLGYASFKIINPNAKSTCGCGTSFSL